MLHRFDLDAAALRWDDLTERQYDEEAEEDELCLHSRFILQLKKDQSIKYFKELLADSVVSCGVKVSEEVVGRFLDDFLFAPPRVGVEAQVLFVHVLVQLQESRLVVAPVAVVGRAEDRGNVVVVLQLVALVHQLMGPRH